MSLARFGSLGDVIGRRKSVDEPTEKSNTPSQEQDYVLVDDSENGDSERDGSKDDKIQNLPTPFDQNRSPIATSVALKAPSEKSTEDEGPLHIPLHTRSLAAFRSQHYEPEDDSIDTARTDYSDLEDHSLPKVLVEKDPIPAMDGVDQQQWEKALEEANQQHQWAMQEGENCLRAHVLQAVLRDWEVEKKALLTKLGRVIEARDTLEAELKHSEHSFAGMLEGILDQKLDQMVHVIQEGNLTRSLSGSTILSPGSQATSLNAQQVAEDLNSMMDSMRAQQAAVEDRITRMQSAVLQLVPDKEKEQSVSLVTNIEPKKRFSRVAVFFHDKLGRPAVGAIRLVHHQASSLCHKVPSVATLTAQKTGGAVRKSASCVKAKTCQALDFCKQSSKNIKKEHLQIVACVLASGIIGTAIASSKAKRVLPSVQPEPVNSGEDNRELQVFDVEPQEDSVLEQSLEIILNRSGVFKRFGKAPEKTLVLAWPRISVEYN